MLSDINTHFFPTECQTSQKFINSPKVLSLFLCRKSTSTPKCVLPEFKEFNLGFRFGTTTTNQFRFAWKYSKRNRSRIARLTLLVVGRGTLSQPHLRGLRKDLLSGTLVTPNPVLRSLRCHSPPPSLPASPPPFLPPPTAPLPPSLLRPHPPPASLPTIVAASQTQCLKHRVPGIYTCQVALGTSFSQAQASKGTYFNTSGKNSN